MDENKQDRLNEMAALESYFADDTTCFEYSDDDGDLHGYIVVKIPKSHEPIKVRASLTANEVYEVSVCHLPPMKMFFSLPDGYPSEKAPEYILTAQWWPQQIEHDVKERLNVLCDEFRTLPLLISCVEAIKQQILESVVTRNNTIDMDMVASERRAERSSGSDRIGPSGLQLLFQMVAYDERHSVYEFDREYFECPVCISSKSGRECARFMPCQHVFCRDCLSEFYRQQLSDFVVKPFCCMAAACSSEASPSLLRSLLPSDQFDRYERLLFEKSLENMEDMVYCPRPNCQSIVVVTSTDRSHPAGALSKLAICSTCDFSFCVTCGKAYHALAPCQFGGNIRPSLSEDNAETVREEFERRQKLLRAFERASDAERESMYRCLGGRRQLDKNLQEIMTERWMAESDGRRCPWCNTYILKDYGCDHMSCINCGNSFCWRCGERLRGKRSTKHFGRNGYSCRGIRNAKQENEPDL
uniref:RBR-type E3 ubiquitin transferase n=1 Tax=Parascaris univalens TaxID=6257 RepID=A0A914ZS58_PARUN